MFGRPKPEVLVSGAGPVGLFAALWLAKRGVRVRIVDEGWRGATHSYALALHPRSLGLLDDVGLIDPILAQCLRIQNVGIFSGSERRVDIELASLPAKFPFLAILPQATFEKLLEESLAKEGVEVEWAHRLARITPGTDHVSVRIDTLEHSSLGYAVAHTETIVQRSEELDVPFVIGADGHASVVRTQLGIEFDTVGPPDHFAVFEFDATGEIPNEVRIVMNDGNTNVMWPMASNRCRWTFQLDEIRAGDDSRDKDRLLMPVDNGGASLLKPELLHQLLRERAPWFTAHAERLHWRMAVKFERRLARSFGSDRTWLAGDSAHTTGPVGGQSMNVGLREAAQLAEILAGNLRESSSREALAAYGSQRLAEWRQLLGVGGSHLAVAGEVSPWLAQRLERVLSCVPASGAHLAQLVGQLGLEATSQPSERSPAPRATG